MVTITLRDAQGYITGLPPEAHDALVAATSFKPAGYQYTVAYQRGRTDGSVRLLSHSKFPAGLIDRVTEVLKKQQVAYDVQVEDSDGKQKPRLGCVAVDMEDRPYQDDAVEAAILNPRGVIRAPTGSGKTAIGARVIAAKDRHALVIVPTIDLLYQYRRFLERHLVWGPDGQVPGCMMEVGQLGDGVVDPRPVTVATVRTAAAAMGVAYTKYEFGEYDDKDDTKVNPAKLREWIESIGTLIVDEAHILGAQTVYDIATKLPAPNKYGFSASPWRDDGADLMIEAATGKQIYRIGTEILVQEGFLVPPIIEVVNTAGWWEPAAWGSTCTCGGTRWRSEFTDCYAKEIVDNPRRNERVAQIVQKQTGPTLVLVKQVKHGKLLEPLIPGSRFLSGRDTGQIRVEVYDDIRSGELQVIIATTIADLGLDVPALRNLILAGGGKSSTRHLQRIGRVARPYPGKTFARVIDFDDTHVHRWFKSHAAARRKIEKAEWGQSALWI
jgi:superfamily II DNA or RNA helicase